MKPSPGSRNYGDDFNVVYTSNPLNGLGYANLNGGAQEQEHVANLNLMATPVKYLTIVPSLRVQSDTWNANSAGIGTQGTFTSPYTSTSDGETLDVRECLDIRYTGVTNWVYYASAELTEGTAISISMAGCPQVNGIGVPPVLELTDQTRWLQKYSLARAGILSAAPRLTLGAITRTTNTTTTILLTALTMARTAPIVILPIWSWRVFKPTMAMCA
ncbi:MAG: hypothetical protein WDM80_10490 [Limisphaerales bacterium]